jgi:hypothetical protein
VAAYLQSVGAVEGPKPQSPASRAAIAAIREDISRRERQPVGVLESLAPVAEGFADASTFGLAGLLTDFLASGNPRNINREAFRARRDVRRQAREDMPLRENIPLAVAGGVANPVGTFLGPAKAGAGLFRIGARGAAEGALQGGAQMLGENIGTTDGVAGPVAAGMVVGGLLGGAAAPIAARVARGRATMAPEQVAAARRLQAAQEADAGLGFVEPQLPTGPGMPRAMEIDRAGPTVIANARAATRSVPGREAIRPAFEARAAEMPQALTEGTEDAVAVGNRLRAERAAQAEADYGAAIEATKGRPVDSPFIEEFITTTRPGRVAWEEVQAARPSVVLGVGDPARALPVVDEVPVPDGEAVHEMSRWLRARAKADPGQVFPDGVGAIEAGNALRLLEKTQDALPEPFRMANENYARLSRPIDALALGRSRWSANPSVSKKADARAIENVRTKMAGMEPGERAMVRLGKSYDLATRAREGTLTPSKAVPKLDTPASTLAWEAALSGSPLPKRLRAWNEVLGTQGKVLSGAGPSLDSGLLGVVDQITAGTSLLGKAATAWRVLRGQLSASAKTRIGKEDAAFMRLLTDEGDATKRLIASLSAKDRAVVEAARTASRKAGRVGGLLTQ